jgi:predicted dehydrogenase
MLRWAILGTGFISHTVAGAIASSTNSELVTVAGRNPDAVAAFQEGHGIPSSTASYEDAINNEDVDAVYIGLPNHKHHELAILAAMAGKAILSEKSLTTTMADAHSLADAVRGRVFFVEGLMYLAHPLHAAAVDLIADEKVGTVRAISARYSADIAAVVNPLGRGTIFNLGCYPASLTQLVIQTAFGDDVFAKRTMWGAGVQTPEETIGQASLSIQFGNGVLATIHSTDDYGMSHHFAVITDRGEIRYESNPWLPSVGQNCISWSPYDGPQELIFVDDEFDAFHHQIKVVESGVRDGRTEAQRPSPRLDDSLELMALLTDWERQALGETDPLM